MNRSGYKVMKELVGLVKPLLGYMILAIMMGVIGHISATGISVLGVFGILNVLGLSDVSLKVIFILLGVFALVRGMLRYLEQAFNHFIAFKLLAHIRDRVFGALRRLAPAKLDGKDKGNLMSVITQDIELLEVFYAHTISPIVIAVVFSIIMISFIGYYDIRLAFIALLSYISVGFVVPYITAYMSGHFGMDYRNQSGELSTFILDSLRGLPEIIQYCQGNKRLLQMTQQSQELSLYEKQLKNINGRNMVLTQVTILLFDMIMFISALFIGDFKIAMICTITLISSFGPVVSLAALGSTLQNTFAAGNRVLDILQENPIVEEVTGQQPISFKDSRVEHVDFSYNDEKILDDVSLSIPKNQIIGIQGKSGSGKSTLLKLMMRFYDVNEGQIMISNRNIKEINTTDLRSMESLVSQETYLFHDTIKNNLLIANPHASDEEIIEACQKASIHDFIMNLKDGYNTVVGELGETLSGGEKQRLSLARAFLHHGDLMLLDEPTANLDSLNEAIILKSLQQQSQNQTVILVSHRLSTMSIVDKLYAMKEGRMS